MAEDVSDELPRGSLAHTVLVHTGWSADLVVRLPPGSGISWATRVVEANMNRALRESWPDLVILKEPHAIHAAEPAPAKIRRPPVQLVVLVLVWLILVAGPLAEGKLPNEIQMMLGTEIGTVSLALAITQMTNQKRK